MPKQRIIASIFFIYILIVVGTVQARQNQIKSLLTAPTGESFDITVGSSFSASTTGGHVNKNLHPIPIAPETVLSDIESAITLIRQNHVNGGSINDSVLIRSGASKMLRALDPHSRYFDSFEFRELLGEHRNEYSGIGVTIANFKHNGETNTYVLSTASGSPASRANLRFGDRIVAIDSVAAGGMAIDEIRERLRGARGTLVRLTIERNRIGVIEMVEIRRDRVPIATIGSSTVLDGGVGYVEMTAGFGNSTADELSEAIRRLEQKGMNSLLLDLRGNRGGLFDEAVKTAELFLPAGNKIVTQQGRLPGDFRSWSSGNHSPFEIPLVILTDGDTASASEIVAGALQDNDRAIIVGEQTFGKGLVQDVIPLPDGSGIVLTSARYFIPSGRSIQRDYSDGYLYDYFRHIERAAAIEQAAFAARTLTGRTVYSGNGISPDIAAEREAVTTVRAALIDAIFFFTREYVGGRIPNNQNQATVNQIDSVRDLNSSAIFNEFKKFIERSGEIKLSDQVLIREESFIINHIRQELARSSTGQPGADLAALKFDPQIAAAKLAVRVARELFQKADHVQHSQASKKSPPKPIPDGARKKQED